MRPFLLFIGRPRHGEPVKVTYTFPIFFQLKGGEPDSLKTVNVKTP